jgi:glycosyltransferase involved in cell wall biosynthesis
MRISIVTTTFNALPYITETTRSVLQSTYEDFEYLIVDAGSTDGTKEFLLGLRDKRLRVEIRMGAGQYEALDWGMRHATGEVLAWINGDDLYFPWTLSGVSRLFTEFPQVLWLTGLPTFINGDGDCTVVGTPSSYPRRYIQNGWFNEFAYGNLVQESMFWRSDLYRRAGGLNLQYELAADFELWTRFARLAPLEAVNVPLAAWRKHGNNRSLIQADTYLREVTEITAHLPRFNSVKGWLCRATASKHALRLAEWHRTPWIYYSLKQSCWKRATAFRPISRYGLQYLRMEYLAARAKRQTVDLVTAHSPRGQAPPLF